SHRSKAPSPAPDAGPNPSVSAYASLVTESDWPDYALLDSGDGTKLERFGPYTLARPDQQAIWKRRLPIERWEVADAVFEKGSGDAGAWVKRRAMPDRWPLRYEGLTVWARLTGFRHTGLFPEQAPHWRWMVREIQRAGRPIQLLDLFAYTGVRTLLAARAGARVTYLDASRPAIGWARENQAASGLDDLPIRWLLDDAIKFVRREARRGNHYDALAMDPPVFGRGPSGEVWRFYESLPILLDLCRHVLSERPLFVLINAYAVEASSTTLANLLVDLMAGHGGRIEAGELGLPQSGSDRILPAGIFGKWSSGE
ncbi:MAG TPA: hypothetical protein VKW77_04460, partial [Acidimicrobiales bacterium]|nr:hypothetical protein [Acidimicrobiales bacterium]